MIKAMTIVGTRPELIKMCRVIDTFDRHTRHVLVHTGQNHDHALNQVFFDELRIRPPDHFLGVAGGSPAATIARVIERADEILAREAPDALLLYGDTNSCLAAIAAKRRKVPVFHMEAGNRCFDDRVPEEINRRIIDHVSDVNVVITEHARRYLLAEGLPADRIFRLGSHLPEVLAHFRTEIDASAVRTRLGLDERAYFLVSMHREENVDDPARLRGLLDTLDAVAERHGLPVVVSTHPRTRDRLERLAHPPRHPLVRFEKPFGFLDYVRLQCDAACVLSDSGSLTEESAVLGFAAIALRDCHERPEGVDAGVLVMAGLERESVLDAIRITLATAVERGPRDVEDYRATDVSHKLLKLVLGYVPFVRERVWHDRR